MKDSKLPIADFHIFALKSLLWLVFAWTAFLLTLVGFFYAWLVWAVFLLGSIFVTSNFVKNRASSKISKELWLVSLGLIIFVVALSFFTTPTLFSGRDQGSISQAAIRLAQNHALTFSTPASNAFFGLRGPGRALNFPGFFYTSKGELTTQFPLVYISWLAAFYGIFGLTGFIIANAVLSLLFLFSFYFLARLFMSKRGSIIALLFASTSLSVFWFPKYTLSENLALPLVWLSIFASVSFLKKQTRLNLSLLLASATLLIFTRIEGIAIFAVCLLVIFWKKENRNYLKSILNWKFFVFLTLLFLVFLANTFWDFNFYKEIIKAVLPPITPPQASTLSSVGDLDVSKFYLLKIFYLYGMLSFFVVALLACVSYGLQRKFFKLMPLLIVAPTLIYFFNSHISGDHPWMLRRFAFSILPAAIFFCALAIEDLRKYLKANTDNLIIKILPLLLAILLVAGNLPAFFHFAFFSENQKLLSQTQQLSEKFSAKDLVLIDNQTTGDGWSMLADPMSSLFGKNAVYFFDTNDLSKLDLKTFDNVFLIAPESKIDYYTNSTIGNRLTPTDGYFLSTSRLDLSQENVGLPENFPAEHFVTISGTIFKVSK